MTSTDTFNPAQFDEQISSFCTQALDAFKQVTRQYALFHMIFFLIGLLELIAFILFFSFFTKTTLFAFSIAAIFLSIFSYFVLLFYFQAKKPEQFLSLRESLISASEKVLSFSSSSPVYHSAIASSLQKMLITLHRQEYAYYSLPASFETLSPLMQKFSVWTHWKDLHQMKELLLLKIIKQRIELIKLQPKNLEAHAHLADAYLALSRLYMDPRKLYPQEEHLWVSPEYDSKEMLEKFRKAAHRALEEYRILDFYAPNDPWVHAQLAGVYRALDLPQEEIQEYEAILKTSSPDPEILLRLGTLYFAHGLSAQGLHLYDILSKNGDPKCEELIAAYGSSLSEE